MPVLNEPDACPVCGRAFAVTLGIPSLGGSEIEPEPQERELIARLVAMYPTATIEEMSAARLAIGATNEDRRTVYNQYHRTLRERGPAFYRMFQERVRQQGWSTAERCVALDIGCGIGGGLLALAQDYERVVGLDISLSSLLIARKVVEQAGLTNVQLVHASAHQLPFAAEMFDFAMAINVLEHVFTPAQMLGEVRRTLKPQGVFTGDSRNRFDLFFKEPHVGLRWVGMLPRRWMETYVRWRIGVDYAATHTYLLSYGDLSRALRATFGTRYCITLPEAAAYGATGAAGAVAEKVNRMKPLRVLTARIAPSHIAVAQRS
jgi:SAM-dependent methyltransferase